MRFIQFASFGDKIYILAIPFAKTAIAASLQIKVRQIGSYWTKPWSDRRGSNETNTKAYVA